MSLATAVARRCARGFVHGQVTDFTCIGSLVEKRETVPITETHFTPDSTADRNHHEAAPGGMSCKIERRGGNVVQNVNHPSCRARKLRANIGNFSIYSAHGWRVD